jgi:hypothetical protein
VSNKDKYHPSNGVLEPRVQMPRAKASVRTVPAWGERKAIGGAAGRATPVRHVRGLLLEVVILVVGLESWQEVSLLGALLLVLNMGMGGSIALR